MTTQTRKRRPPSKVQRPDNDPVPQGWRWLRVLLTILASLAVFVGLLLTAVAFRHNSSFYPPAGLAVLGVALFAYAQRPGLYLALSGKFGRRTGKVIAVASSVDYAAVPADIPRPRGRRKAEPEGPPPVEPDASLPRDFRWMVGAARRVEIKRRELLDPLRDVYATLMAEDDTYHGAVVLVRTIATEWKKDGEPGERYAEDGEEGFDDRRNPGLFLAELDRIGGAELEEDAVSSAIAAIAAAMLIHDDPDVTKEVMDAVMSPWVETGLPFLYNGKQYKLGDDGNVHKVEKPPAGPAAPAQAGGAAPPPAYAPPAPADRVDVALGDVREGAVPPAGDLFPAHQSRPAGNPPPVRRSATGSPSQPAAAAPAQYPYTVSDLAMAAGLVMDAQLGSTSMLQRKMHIGFGTAGALMDRLEVLAIVGPADPARPAAARPVLERREDIAEVQAWIEENEGGTPQ